MPSTRDEGAGLLQAPAAAAKEEQLVRHSKDEYISRNGFVFHAIQQSEVFMQESGMIKHFVR